MDITSFYDKNLYAYCDNNPVVRKDAGGAFWDIAIDIVSFGIEGLIDAIEKYSPKFGARFETYALVRIRGNIIDKIRSQDFLPRSVRRKIRDVKEAQEELKRLDYRMKWEDDFRNYLIKLDNIKPVIVCGDLNVAHKEIDLKNPKTNRKNAGFSDEERGKMTELLSSGFTDSFRYLYPNTEGVYSWWSYRFQARAKNSGWRIDYFIVSDSLQNKIDDAKIYTDIYGSDHCPVGLILK